MISQDNLAGVHGHCAALSNESGVSEHHGVLLGEPLVRVPSIILLCTTTAVQQHRVFLMFWNGLYFSTTRMG